MLAIAAYYFTFFYIYTITYCSGRANIVFNYLVSETARLYFKQTALEYCS